MIIRPGEKLDIDGVITNGTSQFDMKSLTGETIPVTKGVGDSVLAGSVSLDGTVTVKAEKEYKDSTVSRILDMLENHKIKKLCSKIHYKICKNLYSYCMLNCCTYYGSTAAFL